jgi:hypothetical protein
MSKSEDKSDKTFFQTIPGIITAFAALLTAIGGCIAVVFGIPAISNAVFGVTPTPIISQTTSSPAVNIPALIQEPTSIPPTAIPPTAIPPTVAPPTAIPPTEVPPTAIPPTESPVGSPEWYQQLEPLKQGTITGDLVAGKFRTQSDLVGVPIDGQRNTLITELGGRTNESGGYFQSLDNDTLAGVGALVVFFRAAKIRNDQDIKNMTIDGIRNTFIVEIGARTGLGDSLQGYSNIELVRLALGLQWP